MFIVYSLVYDFLMINNQEAYVQLQIQYQTMMNIYAIVQIDQEWTLFHIMGYNVLKVWSSEKQ